MSASSLPLVISASPRPDGNSDRAAALFAAGAGQAAGAEVPVLALRKHPVEPCTGCSFCERAPSRRCRFHDRDDAEALFETLAAAPSLFIAAPIYFYHLPAPFKAWIDRSQSWWLRLRDGDERLAALPPRPVRICLVAGRKQGARLFEGSLLTLKYFLGTFNYHLEEPLTLLGLDGPDELAARESDAQTLLRMGADAVRAMPAGRD